MKKLPLLLALSCLTLGASAQQKDFFDVQKYLQKKSKEKTPVAKPLVHFEPSLQNFQTSLPQLMISQNKLSHILANGDKVYLLLQDNMPCITTEINRFDIGNVYKEHTITTPFTVYNNLPGSMPNVSVPYRVFISR